MLILLSSPPPAPGTVKAKVILTLLKTIRKTIQAHCHMCHDCCHRGQSLDSILNTVTSAGDLQPWSRAGEGDGWKITKQRHPGQGIRSKLTSQDSR